MKKLLSLAGGMAMAAAMFMASAQDAPAAPEALYLVGQFSNWTAPVDGGTEFALTDEDGDGKYTGTYNIEANELMFKVFSSVSDWSDATKYFGATGPCEPLYSDVEWTAPLYPGEGGNYNVDIINWQGGEVTFSAQPVIMDGEIMLIALTMTAPTQPARPLMPEAVYCIGSFNDWKTPEADNLNGAVKIPAIDGAYGLYMDNIDLPAGAPEFKFYYTDNEGKSVYIGTDTPAFTLYKYGLGYNNMYAAGGTADAVGAFKMRDWAGTAVFGTLDLVQHRVQLGAVDGPSFQAPAGGKMYAIVTLDSQEPKLIEVLAPELDTDMWNVSFNSYTVTQGESLSGIEKVTVLFTTENSLTPSPESCWGVITVDETAEFVDFATASVCQGGKPFVFAYPADGINEFFSIYMQMQLGLAYLNSNYQMPKTEIYLIGQPQGWDIKDGSMPLKLAEGETEVYEATYEIAAGTAMFRFYEDLGDWDKGSIGSQVDDMPVDVTLPENALYSGEFVWGKGAWNIPDWKGGKMYFKVDMKNNTVMFGDAEIVGVGKIDAAEGEVRYFDLQGRRVQNPDKGLYIRVESTGKSSKVAL